MGCGKKGVLSRTGVEPEKIAKSELRHQVAATFDPRAEFANVLREIGATVEGKHPIMDGKPQRIRAEKDKRGEQTIFYIGHLDRVWKRTSIRRSICFYQNPYCPPLRE
jgi:hypothetical protein